MTTMESIENWLSYKSLSWSMDYQPLSIVYYKVQMKLSMVLVYSFLFHTSASLNKDGSKFYILTFRFLDKSSPNR